MTDKDDEEADSPDEESLPFDVEMERLPTWVHVASLAVVIVGVLVTAHLVPMLAFLPFLLASSIGRRFLHVQTHLEVDPRALSIADREIPRADIIDVWLDSDDIDARVAVHSKDADKGRVSFSIFYFVNRDQAVRFAEALRAPLPATQVDEEAARPYAAGYAPGPIDLLSSLRFVAVGASFVESGRYLSLPVFAFAALGIATFVRARQVIADKSTFTVRSAFGAETHPYSDVASVVVESGAITLRGGRVVSIARSAIRDGMLASPAWLERTRRRVLKRIRDHARDQQGDA